MCNEIWIYVFPEKELRGLRPNFNIHVSVSDLCIPKFGRLVVGEYKIAHRNMNVGIGTVAAQFLSNLRYCAFAV